jgi:pimeloyl-ACP methyl ester carboxylesterase
MKHAIPQRATSAARSLPAEAGEQPSRVLRLGLLLLLALTLLLLFWSTRPLLAQEGEPAPTEEGAPPEEAPPSEEPPPDNPLVTRLQELEGYPCPLPDFGPGVEVEPPLDPATGEPSEEPFLTCVTLNVPYDHANPDDEHTLDVVFGIKPAPGRSRGMMVVAVGGPGGAGIESAYYYLTMNRFGDLLPQEMDLLFFDQRGVGLSNPLDCPAAIDDYYDGVWNDNPETPAGEAEMIAEAKRFAESCQEEMGAPDLQPYLATSYAVEDLELFLEKLDQKQIYLYGESYGTQYAQTYAAAHPERIAGLILDGVVDLSMEGEAFYRTYVKVIYDNLLATLKDCNDDRNCAEDLGGDAVTHFEAMVKTLKAGPVTVKFPLPSGGFEERPFSYQEFRLAVGGYDTRATLQALAAAAQEDYLPLLRLYYALSLTEPQLNKPAYLPDLYDMAPAVVTTQPNVSAFSDGAYYNVDCSDYQFFEGTPEERAQAFLAAGNVIEAEFPVFSNRFYTDLPCVFWPTDGPDERPEPFTGGRYPTFVINGTADTQTPIDNGYQVYERLTNGYMITKRAGGHVHFGGGCADKILTQFLLQRVLPGQREFLCPGYFLEDRYTPLAKAKASDYKSPLALVEAVIHEIEMLPELNNMVTAATLVGCPHGGVMGIGGTWGSQHLSFANCAFIEGFAMTGSGFNGFSFSSLGGAFFEPAPSVELYITVTGDAEGQITYLSDGESGTVTIDGTYAGKPLKPTVE